jgi:hypothetical protein
MPLPIELFMANIYRHRLMVGRISSDLPLIVVLSQVKALKRDGQQVFWGRWGGSESSGLARFSGPTYNLPFRKVPVLEGSMEGFGS